MYRFYWQSGVEFTSSADSGELFFNMLRNIPPMRNMRPGSYLVLYNMRHTGTYHEVIRFEVNTRKHPYIDIQSLFDLRHDIAKFVRA